MKKTNQLSARIFKTVLLTLIITFLFSCNANRSVYNQTDSVGMVDSAKAADSARLADSTKMKDGEVEIPKSDTTPNWSYDTTKDEMTSGSTITAITQATNNFELAPPYDGDNWAQIQLRRRRGNTDIIFQIEKGQFMGGVEGTNIKVRFDENRYSEYYCNPASDYDPTVLFLTDVETFIEHLKKAKKLIIEADIYDNGGQEFEFSVDGLKWGKPKPSRKKTNGVDLSGFTVSLPKDGKEPPKRKGFITLTGTNRKGHDTVIYVKGDENTVYQ